jgi:hypothetical protein
MTLRTFDGLTHRTVSDGCICHRNHEFTNVDGLAPMFAFSPGQVLNPRVLDSMVYDKHTLGTAPGGDDKDKQLLISRSPSPSYNLCAMFA